MFLKILLVVVFLLPATVIAGDGSVLRFAGVDVPGLTPSVKAILTQAYGRLGYKVEFLHGTPERTVIEANSGRVDGELARIGRIGTMYPELVQVKVPVLTTHVVGYTGNRQFRNSSVEDISGLRVGYVEGAVFAELATKGFKNLWTVQHPLQLFSMLQSDRLDVIVLAEIVADALIEKHQYHGFLKIDAPLQELVFYHYLHTRNAHLAPKLEAVLRDMLHQETDETDRSPAARNKPSILN